MVGRVWRVVVAGRKRKENNTEDKRIAPTHQKECSFLPNAKQSYLMTQSFHFQVYTQKK